MKIQEPREVDAYLRAETGSRGNDGWAGILVALLAGGWSLFQLAIAKFWLLPSEVVRCVHLACAIALVFICFPALKSSRLRTWFQGRPGWLFEIHRLPVIDLLLAILAAAVALYLAIDYEGIGRRLGLPLARDIVIGILLILLLLEAARRALGPALPTIAGIFILYSFVSERLPALIAFKNASLSKVINKLTMTTEGIYGVPLDVSANVVFLFVLFGAMLEKAGGGQYFIQVAFSLLGRFRGGPAKAAVLASGLTGMVNGSSIANTVTTGTFTIPLMKKAGMPGIKAGAIEVAASTNGQLMPPIMGAAAFIIAEYCNMTYLEVVRAAAIPAFISYLALIYITHLEAGKLNLKPIPRDELPRFWPTFLGGIHFLIPLVFLIYQLVIARRSAQYAAFDAIVALAVLVLSQHLLNALRKKVTPAQAVRNSAQIVGASLVAGARAMMSIGVAVAAAGIIVGIVTLGLGGVITDLIHVLSGGNLVLMLLITAVVSLILGMGLPTTANYIVMATLTAPAIIALAGSSGYEVPLIAAHLFCFYFGILSDDTPPVGLSAYAAAAISGEDPIRTGIQGFGYDIRTALLPFMFIFNTDLLLLGVASGWHIVGIFLTGTLAMFAFCALVQRHLRIKLRWYEAIPLVFTVALLLRPDFWQTRFGWSRAVCYAIGIALFAAAHLLQGARMQRQSRPFAVPPSGGTS